MKNTDTPSIERLKTCPFCEHEDELLVLSKGAGGETWHEVYCDHCCASGPANPTRAEAIAGWNTRATLETLPSAGEGVELPSFRERVRPWLLECFGEEIAADRIERNHRFLEESLELVQSLGCTQSEAHQLVDYVFNRPIGEPSQEAGGVMVTLAALCLAAGLDMHAAGEAELARISVPETVAKIRAKQAAKPKHSPLPQSAPEQLDIEGRAREPSEAAYRDAVALADALWRAHYREQSPNWKPLPDLCGVISQIDNMTTGLTSLSTTEIRREALEEAAKVADNFARYATGRGRPESASLASLIAADIRTLPDTKDERPEGRQEVYQGPFAFPYQATFNAIAAAVDQRNANGLGISVAKFEASYNTSGAVIRSLASKEPCPPSRPSFDKWDYARAVLKDSEGCGR